MAVLLNMMPHSPQWLTRLLVVLSLMLPTCLSANSPPCSTELQERFAPSHRPYYPLVIGAFTAEQFGSKGGYTDAQLSANLRRQAGYRRRRSAIRRMWKVDATAAGVPMFFVLSGYNASGDDEAEARQYRDMVFLPDPEGRAYGYGKLPYKTQFLLQYMARQCARFGYFLKADDDTYVSIPRLLSYIDAVPSRYVRIGRRVKQTKVLLDGEWGNRGYRTATGLKNYPTYLQGGGYLLSQDVVHAFGVLSAAVPLTHGRIEDAILGTWLLGWNITTVLLSTYEYLDFIEDHVKLLRALCHNRWLIIHHKLPEALPSYFGKMCPNSAWQ